MRLRDLGIRFRLAAGLGIILAVLGVGAVFGVYGLVTMRNDVLRLVDATQRARTIIRTVDTTGRADRALRDVLEEARATTQTGDLALPMVIIVSIVTLLLSFAVGSIFARSVNNPIKNLVKAAATISEGDLSHQIEVTGKDETGKLEETIKKMAINLRQLAEKLVKVIDQLSAASSEIQATSEQQASGATEQAASVSEVTSAISELATNAKQVAEAAASVSQAANDALESALEGRDAVHHTVGKMEEIKNTTNSISQRIMALEGKSNEIGSILAIIDDIAEQTNLLALNAAIEAARAGEAGKGFAVVAREIRNLAEDVSSSTKEISDKITEIQTAVNSSVMAAEEALKKTDEGVKVVKGTGEGLEKIISVTEHTAKLAKQISGATQQQETASEQVVQTMSEVSEVARQSAAGSQQSAKSAEDLAQMATELKEMVAIFKLDSTKKVGV
jgi:methyl-accepting chemotaxis protein